MKQSIIYAAVFALGVTAGSVATWQYVKKKYEQIAQEEIDSVKEAFSRKNLDDKSDSNNDILVEPVEEEQKVETQEKEKLYTEILTNNGYVEHLEKKIVTTVDKEGPYVISPDEYGEIFDYDAISLTYYDDGVLTDDNDNVIYDYENCVGRDFMHHFGEYEDDSVFIRNDVRKCDYEILYDLRAYAEVISSDSDDEYYQ